MTRIDDWLALNPDFANDPFDKMDAAGLLRPEPDVRNVAAIKAELARRTGLMGVGGAWGGRQLVYRHFVQGFGTEAQKQAWAGKCLAVAISEPKVGAHPKLLTTRADRRGDMVELTGEKAWASNAPAADALIVFAIVAEEAGRKRYGAFIVPRGTPGLTIEEMPGFHALRPSKHARVVLDRCAVPASAQLGPDGSAYERMALTFRDVEDAVVRRPFRPGQSGSVHAEHNVEVLQADLLENLVEAALQERAVDIDDRPHPRLGHPGGKGHGVSLTNAGIEEPIGEFCTDRLQLVPFAHGRGQHTDAGVLPHGRQDRVAD